MYYIFKFLNERREAIKNAELHEKKIIQELASASVNDFDRW